MREALLAITIPKYRTDQGASWTNVNKFLTAPPFAIPIAILRRSHYMPYGIM